MSNQILSGGPGVFPVKYQESNRVPIHSVNNTSSGMYIGQGRVSDHVETPITITVQRAGINYNVNTVNHCIFCLRRTTENPESITLPNVSNYSASSDKLKEVPCAPPEYFTSASPLLFALNKIWSHLQKAGLWDWDDTQGNAGRHSTKFRYFPKICYYCAAEFNSICDLMCQLKAEINKLGVVIRESKKGGAYSWRAESFEKTLKGSAVHSKCIRDTLEFLGIPQENQSSDPVPNSLGMGTLGPGMETEMPAVITETLLNDQSSEEETSPGHFDFHDEGSEDDASNDPNYVKEEEDAFSDCEETSSASEYFDEDPLDDNSDSKPELDQSLTSAPEFVIPILRNTVKIPSQNAISNAMEPTPTRDNSTVSRRSQAKRDWCKEIVIHQQKGHTKWAHQRTRSSEFAERSTDLTLANSISQVKTPIQNVIITRAKEATTTGNKLDSEINSGAKTWYSSEEMKPLQQKDESSTEQEMSGEQQRQPNKSVCRLCRKTFSTPRKLGQHIRIVHDNNTQQQTNKIVCSICGQTFKAQSYLRIHNKNVHNNVKVATLTCDLCKIQVPRKDLYEHVRAHVGEEYLIRCPNPNPGQCSFVCCTPRGLYTHLRSRITCRTATPDVNDKYLKPRDAFICQVCGDDLGSLVSVRVHLNEWHEKEGMKEFPCPIQGCPQRFNFRQSVLLHIPLHVSDLKSESQPCDVCKEKIKCEEMEQHLKDAHHLLEETIIKCFQCPFLFSDRSNLVEHLREHRHIALFCDICGDPDTTFNKHNDLRRHYFEVHQVGSKFLCEHCESEYFSARGLEEHLGKRHPAATAPKKQKKSRKESAPGCSDNVIVETKLKCEECDTNFKTKLGLQGHKIAIHQGKVVSCKFCDLNFTSIYAKYSHEKIHRRGPAGPIKNVKFPCQMPGCGKEFSQKKNLQNHIACAHEGQKPYVCDQCGKAYSSSSHLNRHLQSVHMGVRDHVCDVCGESFFKGSVLKRHKLIHTGDRPFACQLCGQKFRQNEVLKRHFETHERKGADFKPNGPMKQVRKRVDLQSKTKKS